MQNIYTGSEDTIAAVATAPGIGAIAVIRLSGAQSLEIINALFPAKDVTTLPSHTLHYGILKNNGIVLDEVVLSVFKAPGSYTGEHTVEISCHGSAYVQQQILQALVSQGARLALPGEFTQRAFLNGKLDLAQAEAVGDLIAAQSYAAQQTALKQLRGGFSHELKILRDELINFAALIELELDFSEEDVTFADRAQFTALIKNLNARTEHLIQSFSLGNVIKNGVNVAIIGKPNAGKSTLLNALLNEERAIVSDIAGTTRDTIEEVLNIQGILFRLVDTAGVRAQATDTIEQLGIERSKQNAAKADIIIHLKDATSTDDTAEMHWLQALREKTIEVYNKTDVQLPNNKDAQALYISAKNNAGIEDLKNKMFDFATGGSINVENTIVTSERHQGALLKIKESLQAIAEGMNNGLPGDLLSIDIRSILHYLGEITGQVETDRDILGTIFGKFCIGK